VRGGGARPPIVILMRQHMTHYDKRRVGGLTLKCVLKHFWANTTVLLLFKRINTSFGQVLKCSNTFSARSF